MKNKPDSYKEPASDVEMTSPPSAIQMAIQSPAGEYVYNRRGIVFHLKKINWNDRTVEKYMVSLFKNDTYCGKFTFFTSDKFKPPEIIFSGMYLEPEFRGQGLSQLAMYELQKLADDSGRILCHALPQRKPLTCMILQKNGFIPYESASDKATNARNTVYVGKNQNTPTITDGVIPVPVHFPNPHKAKEFANSSIFHSQPYIIVPGISEIRDAVRCVLNVDYIR